MISGISWCDALMGLYGANQSSCNFGKWQILCFSFNWLIDKLVFLIRNAGGFYKDLEVIVTTAIGCQIGPGKTNSRLKIHLKIRRAFIYFNPFCIFFIIILIISNLLYLFTLNINNDIIEFELTNYVDQHGMRIVKVSGQ